VFVSLLGCLADPAPVIHYAPVENLEQADVALIDRAEHDIDFAAYVLTDRPVMSALLRAAGRGVKIRIFLDGGGNPRRCFGNCSRPLKSMCASSARDHL
jgi:phosphatidylserine/phosphatidylglycerophosphate/cardiolipin synthase-like enzyme